MYVCDEANEQCDKAVTSDIPKTENYVLDGGSLVQHVPRTKDITYGTIVDSSVNFTVRNYDTATVVFDGYQEIPSTKDNTPDRRQQRHHPLVSVSPHTVFS